eukprot:12461113-Ditylum_brightwellii.AAC.1
MSVKLLAAGEVGDGEFSVSMSLLGQQKKDLGKRLKTWRKVVELVLVVVLSMAYVVEERALELWKTTMAITCRILRVRCWMIVCISSSYTLSPSFASSSSTKEDSEEKWEWRLKRSL